MLIIYNIPIITFIQIKIFFSMRNILKSMRSMLLKAMSHFVWGSHDPEEMKLVQVGLIRRAGTNILIIPSLHDQCFSMLHGNHLDFPLIGGALLKLLPF